LLVRAHINCCQTHSYKLLVCVYVNDDIYSL